MILSQLSEQGVCMTFKVNIPRLFPPSIEEQNVLSEDRILDYLQKGGNVELLKKHIIEKQSDPNEQERMKKILKKTISSKQEKAK